MEVESMPPRYRQDRGYSSNLEVLQHSNCLLVACIALGFFCFVVCLGIGMGTGGNMSGFLLFLFIVFGFGGVICWAVVGWQFYKAKRELDDKHNRVTAEIRLLNETSTAVRDAVKHGDGLDFTRNDDKRITDIKITRTYAVLAAQAQRGRVVDAGRFAALPSGQDVTQQKASTINAPAIILPPRLVVPAAYDLMDVMPGFSLAPDNIFLGKDGYRKQVTCDPRTALCHGAFNAATGRGKTIWVRGLETQLLKVGFEVVHADIKFTLCDEKNNDYRPIARALLEQGDLNAGGRMLPHLMAREEDIYHFLYWLAGPELLRRRAMYGAGDHSYSVFFLFLEELYYLMSMYKDLGGPISRLLSVGRSLGIKIFCVAQNFQVQNLKINSGMRECFESAWYLGGDEKSAASVLDMSMSALDQYQAENNIELGDGVTVFRNNKVMYKAGLLRGGMSSNEFVYYMLGRADGFTLPPGVLPSPDETETRSSGVVVPAGYEKREVQRDTQPLVKTAIQPKNEPKRASIPDAIAVWNSFPSEIGRTTMRKELEARGFECSDDLARKFVDLIKEQLKSEGGENGAK